MDETKTFCISAPTQNSKIKELSDFIEKHELCVSTIIGKNRNKKIILIDIKKD